ncbi:hypothetical protein ACQ4PT_034975 [Festuca glaucescens]
MAKYNVVTKNKREHSQERKRRAHGDPNSGKLKQRNDHHAISGKRKRKLQRRLNRDQKEAALLKALENMGDVDMVSAEASSETGKDKPQMKFNVKKNSRTQIKRLKGKGRKKAKNANPPTKEKIDAMVA